MGCSPWGPNSQTELSMQALTQTEGRLEIWPINQLIKGREKLVMGDLRILPVAMSNPGHELEERDDRMVLTTSSSFLIIWLIPITLTLGF